MSKNKKDKREEYRDNVPGANGDYKVEDKKMQNAVAKVLCVLAAVLLWFYVAGTNMTIEERSFSGLPVTIRNREMLAEKGIGDVIKGSGSTIDVTVRGSKADLERLAADKIVMFVDVNEVSEAGEQYLEVQASLPSGITVAEKSTDMLPIYIGKNITKSVPVEVELSYTMEGANYIEESECEYDRMLEITGPEFELETVSHALVSFDLGDNVNSSRSTTARPVLISKSGEALTSPYITMKNTSVKIYVPVYTEKNVPLAVEFKNGYLKIGENAEVDIQPDTVRIKGDPVVLGGIKEIPLEEIDERYISDSGSALVSINNIEGVEVLGGVKSASVNITHIGTELISVGLQIDEINSSGDSENKFVIFSRYIPNITFRVPEYMLESGEAEPIITDDDVYIELDYRGITLVPGGQDVPLNIQVTNKDLTGKVYPVGEYSCYVNVQKNADESNS